MTPVLDAKQIRVSQKQKVKTLSGSILSSATNQN